MTNNEITPAHKAAWAQTFEIQLAGKSPIQMRPADIPRLLNCEKATLPECVLFLKQCQQRGANPFMRDMYIIKYGNKPASIVTGVGFFQKKAQGNPKFEGFCQTTWLSAKLKKWVTVWIPSIHGEWPLACTASCHVKGYREKQTFSVNWEENKKDTNTWRSMPSRMLEKVAMVGLLRQTFPDDFSGLYIQEEIDGNTDTGRPAVEPANRKFNNLENVKKAQEHQPEGVTTTTFEMAEEVTPERKENLPDIACTTDGKAITKEEFTDPVITEDGEIIEYPKFENTPEDPSLFGKDINDEAPKKWEGEQRQDDEIPF